MIVKVRKNTNDRTRELFEAGYNAIVSDFNAGGNHSVTNCVCLYEKNYSERYPMNAIDTALKDIANAGYYVWSCLYCDGTRLYKITESNVRPDSSCRLLYSTK